MLQPVVRAVTVCQVSLATLLASHSSGDISKLVLLRCVSPMSLLPASRRTVDRVEFVLFALSPHPSYSLPGYPVLVPTSGRFQPSGAHGEATCSEKVKRLEGSFY